MVFQEEYKFHDDFKLTGITMKTERMERKLICCEEI